MLKGSGNNVRDLFSRIFSDNKVPHAVGIFTHGYVDAARELAASIVCEKRVFPPCGTCIHCRKALSDIHPDVETVAPAKGKTLITVDQIRKIRSDAYILPNDSDRKVYIISGCSAMNAHAQNALLKILEEPPAFVYFILADTDATALLDTVKSRLAMFSFSGEQSQTLSEYSNECRDLIDCFLSGNEAGFFETVYSYSKTNKFKQFLGELSECTEKLIEKNDGNSGKLLKLFNNIEESRIRLDNSAHAGITAASLCAGCWEDKK